MTKLGAWEWWFDTCDDGEFEYARSREDAIESGLRDVNIGESFKIVEARLSVAKKHENHDFIPFAAQRNPEWITKTEDGFRAEPA